MDPQSQLDATRAPGGGERPGLPWREVLASFVAYSAVFAVLAWPWLRAADHAAPNSNLRHPADEREVAWILAWVSHALGTAPRHLMDANVYYPAPGQLTGIELFLSTQLVFAPVFWATHNAVLGANAAVLLSYPLAAVAMERLLIALGCGRPVAWTAGLVFALGPLRVPGNLMILKYVNLYLPLIALALTRLRQRPANGPALGLGMVMALAFLSSYYAAVMAAVAAAIWFPLEWLRPAPGRRRFAFLAVAAIAAALALLVVVSLPYLRRPEASATFVSPLAALAQLYVGLYYLASMDPLSLGLAGLGAALIGSAAPAARRAARWGLVITVVSALLMVGPTATIGGWTIPLPFAVIANSPARFFRAPSRFVVVLGFGTALLAAAALEAAWRRLGRRAGGLAVAAVAAAIVATHGSRLAGSRLEVFREQSQPIYAAVKAVAEKEGPGPVLELPFVPILAVVANPGFYPSGAPGAEAMLGSTRHWQPLIIGETAYPPPHWPLVAATLGRLPANEAFQDLVDMTHVRWLLLRPREEWFESWRAARDRILALQGVKRILVLDGWELLRVDRIPQHPGWFAAIAAGYRPQQTVLGTPLAPLPPEAARAVVMARGAVPAQALAGSALPLSFHVVNIGAAPWPVAVPPQAARTHTVGLEARWWLADQPHAADTVQLSQEFELLRDVWVGEDVIRDVFIIAPTQPGSYDLEIRVHQVAGADFDGPENKPLRARVVVAAPSPGSVTP